MRYRVYCDDTLIHDGFSPLKNVHLIDPVVKITDNGAGSFTFKIPPINIGYDICEKFKSTLYVYEDNEIIWSGRIISEDIDFWNQRKCSAEGALAYLNDTNQEHITYTQDATDFIYRILELHNSKKPLNRQIIPGSINAVDIDDNHLYMTNYGNTLSELNEHIISRLGGHLKLRYRSSDRAAVLDYSMGYSDQIDQTIEFGYNLIDFTRSWDLSELVTVVVPRGKLPTEDDTSSTANIFTATLIDENVDYRVVATYREKRIDEKLSEVSITDVVLYSNLSTLYDVEIKLKIGDNPERIAYVDVLNTESNKSISALRESFTYNKEDTIRSINGILTVTVGDTSAHKSGTKSNTTIITIPVKEPEKTISEETKEYLTVASINENSIYVINDYTCAEYGRVERVIDFNDVDDPDTLMQLAEIYLEATQFDEMTLSINAIDLHILNPEIHKFNILDKVMCISPKHGLRKEFPVTEISIPLDSADKTNYTLGNRNAKSESLSSRSVSTTSKIANQITTSTDNAAEKALEKVDSILAEYARIYDGVITNAHIDQADVNNLSANYAHISEGVIDNAKIYYADVDELEAHYAHITNGVIDNAYIDQASVNNLSANYAHMTNGVIDNATIGYADVDGLSANYAHMTDGVIDNAIIGYADVYDLENHYAHIQNGTIDNAYIDQARVNNLSANYAHMTNGVIDNAYIDQARVNNLSTSYAHITNGVIDNADINYARVRDLNTHYALVDMSNTNNAWITNGVIKDAAITDAMILGVSANKITAGTIDAGVIRVVNLNADNITTGTINGQRIGTGTINLSALADDVYTQDDIDDMIEVINNRIDSSIETFTGNVIPTLTNAPANSWITSDVKSTHVGDIYYVVNPSLPENGYAYRFSEINGVFSWERISDSDVTAALNRLQTVEDKVVIIERFDNEISSWKTSTNSTISSMQAAHTQLVASVDKAITSTVQLWYTKSNTSAPSKPGNHVSSKSTNPNTWTLSVPIYNETYPYYFYCYEHKYVDNTYGWSDVVLDNAMTEAQSNSNNSIESSVQLWVVDIASTFPSIPYVDQNGTVIYYYDGLTDSNGNNIVDNTLDRYLSSYEWSTNLPEYYSDRPYYFYCWEYHHIDGHVSWSNAIFDKTITDMQRKDSELTEALNYKVDVTVFNEVKQGVDENSATITRLSETVDNNNQTLTQSVNSVRQTANSNESKISNLTTRLGTNADGTAGSQDIVAKHSALEQTVDSFQTIVSQTYATKEEVDNIVVGGRNLLRLTKEFIGTYLVDELGTSLLDSSGLNIETTERLARYLTKASSQLLTNPVDGFGVRYLDMSSSSSSSYDTFVEFADVIIPEINKNYILSFYVKGANKIRAYFYPSRTGESVTTETSQGITNSNSNGSVDINVTNSWNRVWIKWKVSGTSTSNTRNILLRLYGGSIAYIYGVKFEEGTKVTAWTPAPEDNEDYNRKMINGVVDRIVQAETKIIQNSESIALKASQADTYTIAQVDGIIEREARDRSSEIQLNTNEILTSVSETYATNTFVNGLSNRVTTAETTIAQHSDGIALKADKSTTYTKDDVNGLINTEVTNRNLAIEANVNGLSTTVSQTYARKDDVNNIVVSGQNLLRLTETFSDDYISDSNGLTITDSNSVAFGNTDNGYISTANGSLIDEYYENFNIRSLDMLSDGSSTYKTFVQYSNLLIPKIGTTYIFSFFAKGVGKIRAYFYPNPSGGTCTGISSQNVNSTSSIGSIDFTLSDIWTRYWVKWTIGGTSTAYRHVRLRLYGGNKADVAGLKFEEATVPSVWSASLEDREDEINNRLSNIQESIIETRSSFDITTDAIRSTVSKKTDTESIISTINQSAENILISAEKVDIQGAAIFSSIDNDFEAVHNSFESLTDQINFIETNTETINTQLNTVTSDVGTINTQLSTITSDINSLNSSIDSIQSSQLNNYQVIYYSQKQDVSPASITKWITDSTGGQHKWTTVRPVYSKTYPVLWTAQQRKTADGNYTNTSPVIDNTTTIINGGSIITGSINANKLAANELSLGYFTQSVQDSINDVANMLRKDNFESDYLPQINNAIAEAATTATNYLQYSSQTGELTIGAVTSAIKNVLTNSSQVYRTDTGDIAGFGMFEDRWEMFINTARIGNPIDGTGFLRFNDFQWMSRSNGNMTLKYVG